MAVNTGGQIQPGGLNTDLIQNLYNTTSATDLANALKQIQATAAGQLQNTQEQTGAQKYVADTQAKSALDVANTTGQFGLAGIGLQNTGTLQNTLLGNELKGLSDIAVAQTTSLPSLLNTSLAVDKYSTVKPYMQQILGQISPLISNIGSYFAPGGASNTGISPSGQMTVAGQPQPVPQGVPTSVISPDQQQALLAANSGMANNYLSNTVGGVTPLQRQLANQNAAANASNLQNATTQFLGAIQPANAQQALGAGQLQELGRANRAQEGLSYGDIANQRLQGIGNFLSNTMRGGLNLGG